MGILARLLGWRVRKPIEDCRANVVSPTLALFLFERYVKKYEREKASALAAAVTNELFGLPPDNDAGPAFLAPNKSLVDGALRDIKSHRRICYIVSLITHMLAKVAGDSGTFSAEMRQSVVRLRELEILLPIEQIRMPTSPEGLTQQAQEFELWVIKN